MLMWWLAVEHGQISPKGLFHLDKKSMLQSLHPNLAFFFTYNTKAPATVCRTIVIPQTYSHTKILNWGRGREKNKEDKEVKILIRIYFLPFTLHVSFGHSCPNIYGPSRNPSLEDLSSQTSFCVLMEFEMTHRCQR